MCSTSKLDLVRSIGAEHVIDYTQDDFADGVHHYDLIVDTAGNRSMSHLRRALTPKGTIVFVGGEEGGKWTGGVESLLGAMMLSPFIGQKLRGLYSRESKEDLQVLSDLLTAGKVAPVIDRTYQLSEVPEAVRRMETTHARGKVVITV